MKRKTRTTRSRMCKGRGAFYSFKAPRRRMTNKQRGGLQPTTFSTSIYREIQNSPERCIEIIKNRFDMFCSEIYLKCPSSNATYAFLDKYIFALFLDLYRQFHQTFSDINVFKKGQQTFEYDHKQFKRFVKFISYSTISGKILKQFPFVCLTKSPADAQDMLETCKDDEEYCPMPLRYYFIDRDSVSYVCGSKDANELQKINSCRDLQHTIDGKYLYCVVPSGELRLFSGHHSAGACGQPVICAGHVVVFSKKIFSIDNHSGHYRPPVYMLQKAINILYAKGIIPNNPTFDLNREFYNAIINTSSDSYTTTVKNDGTVRWIPKFKIGDTIFSQYGKLVVKNIEIGDNGNGMYHFDSGSMHGKTIDEKATLCD